MRAQGESNDGPGPAADPRLEGTEINSNLLDLIGNTPLLALHASVGDPGCVVAAKLEWFNPGGSVKDRPAARMIAEAEKRGDLKPGSVIVEATSGNTGVGLALVAAQRGYRCIFVMPDKMSPEKFALLRAYGAEVITCPTAVEPDDPRSYYSVTRHIAETTPGAWQPSQYHNPVNADAHEATTGPEIWRQTAGRITHFVAGAGTGGTVTGTARYLKSQNPDIQVVVADPLGSVYSGGTGRPYLVEGVGEDFWPSNYDPEVVDRVIAISDADSFAAARRAAAVEGLLVGGSAGTALAATTQLVTELDDDAMVVVLLPDSGRNYLTRLYDDPWMIAHGFPVERHEMTPQVTLSDVIEATRANRPGIVYVRPDETIGDAIDRMERHHVSQLPVFTAEPPVNVAEVVGSVTLAGLRALLDEDTPSTEQVGEVMEAKLPTAGAFESADAVIDRLVDHGAVLVAEEGQAVGVLTPEDVEDVGEQ